MSLDAISINTNIKTATNIFEAVYSDQLLHIAESAQDRE